MQLETRGALMGSFLMKSDKNTVNFKGDLPFLAAILNKFDEVMIFSQRLFNSINHVN